MDQDHERIRACLRHIEADQESLSTLEQDVKARLTAAQVLLRIAPFCRVDKELSNVPSTRLFPRLTGHQAKVDNWI
jgi:hypothetical protein